MQKNPVINVFIYWQTKSVIFLSTMLIIFNALNLIVIISITMNIFSVFLSIKNSVKTNHKTIRLIHYKYVISHSKPKAADPIRTPLLIDKLRRRG